MLVVPVVLVVVDGGGSVGSVTGVTVVVVVVDATKDQTAVITRFASQLLIVSPGCAFGVVAIKAQSEPGAVTLYPANVYPTFAGIDEGIV